MASTLLLADAGVRVLPAFIPIFVTVACAEPTAQHGDAGALAAVGQGSEAHSDLAINEIAPGLDGQADWIEIVNRSDQAIDLCDYFITDDFDRLDHYLGLGGTEPPDPCPSRWLDPGQYLVVWADDRAEPAPDHAPFKLAAADGVVLGDWTGGNHDGLTYLHQDGQTSLARVPDGAGRFFATTPSPGLANPEQLP